MVGQSDPGGEELLTRRHAEVSRVAANPAQKNLVGGGVEVKALELDRPIARHQGIILIAQSQRGGKLGRNPVAITYVPAKLPLLAGHFRKLDALADAHAAAGTNA